MKQKNGTKDTEKKLNKREKTKHPALKKTYNLKLRADYIEPNYVDGVYDPCGNQVIRALTEEEKQFLNNFYEESINSNFYHTPELKKLHREIQKLKKLENPTDEELERLDYLSYELLAQGDEDLLYSEPEEQRRIYNENNARNRCLYNRMKSGGRLEELTETSYDCIHDCVYVCPDTGENLLINQVELQNKLRIENNKRKKLKLNVANKTKKLKNTKNGSS